MLPFAPSAVSLAVTMVALTPATEVPVPPFAMGRMPLTCVVKLTLLSVPPRVRLPVVVTVPVSVMPLTVPVPPTLVTPVEATVIVPAPVVTVMPVPAVKVFSD